MAKRIVRRAHGISTILMIACNAVIGFAQTNPVQNPGFESWASGTPVSWVCSGKSYMVQESALRYEGGSSIRFQVPITSTVVDVSQDIPVTAGATCRFSCRAYDNTTLGELGLIVNWRNSGGSLGYVNSPRSTDLDEWQEIGTGYESAPTGATIARVRIRAYTQAGSGGGWVYADLASFSEDVSLPVGIVSFSAKGVRDGVEIRWIMASENNFVRYTVLRSDREQGPFEEAGTAFCVNGGSAGNEYRILDPNAPDRTPVWYRLTALNRDGMETPLCTREYRPAIPNPTPVNAGLDANYPNPFNPCTTVRYRVPAETRVRILVFDALGRIAATLRDQDLRPGEYSEIWDGKDSAGGDASNGIYFCRMETGDGFVQCIRMIKCE
jgi:hypothetical protein